MPSTNTRRVATGTGALALCAALMATALPAQAQGRPGGGVRVPPTRFAPSPALGFRQNAPAGILAGRQQAIGALANPARGYGYGYGYRPYVNGSGAGVAALNGNGFGRGIAAYNGNGFGRGIAAFNGNGASYGAYGGANGSAWGNSGYYGLNPSNDYNRVRVGNGYAYGGGYGGYGGGYGGYDGGYAVGGGGYVTSSYGGYPAYGTGSSGGCTRTQTTYSDTAGNSHVGSSSVCN